MIGDIFAAASRNALAIGTAPCFSRNRLQQGRAGQEAENRTYCTETACRTGDVNRVVRSGWPQASYDP